MLLDRREAARLLLGTLIMTLRTRTVAHQAESLRLPAPRFEGVLALERALRVRRSIREYARGALAVADASQLLWAAQGVTHAAGLRTAPSAGALYPLETYLLAGNVTDLPPGVYHYEPGTHTLSLVSEGDRRRALAHAALGQGFIATASAVVVICAVYRRTTSKYGERGSRYVHMEVGHVAQNVYLQAAALGLGTVVVGAFDDEQVRRVLDIRNDDWPLCVMPIGRV